MKVLIVKELICPSFFLETETFGHASLIMVQIIVALLDMMASCSLMWICKKVGNKLSLETNCMNTAFIVITFIAFKKKGALTSLMVHN